MDSQQVFALVMACVGSIGVVIIARKKFAVERQTTNTLEQVQGVLQDVRCQMEQEAHRSAAFAPSKKPAPFLLLTVEKEELSVGGERH